MLGQRIGPYQVVRQIGAGGMGKVYEAVHEQLGRRAAIKVLHAHLAADSQVTTRFLNEGRAASLIDHPGIVQIFELGQLDGGAPYIVMELLRGESLRQRMDRAGGPLPGTLALRIVKQIGDALVAAHARGVVHRDLKPDNVMIVPDPAAEGGERTKLLDFGIAKLAEGLIQGGAPRTQTGALLGTPLYMAPEQCLGAGRASDRTDVYAAGVMLYQMLAGAPPIDGAGVGDLMVAHIVTAPIPIRERNPAIPDELAALVHHMLAKNPEERPAMNEVVASLDPFLRAGASLPPPPLAHPGAPGPAARASGPAPVRFGRLALVAGAVLALAAGVVGTAWLFEPPAASPEKADVAAKAAGPTEVAPLRSLAPAAAVPASPPPEPVAPDKPIAPPDAGAADVPPARVPASPASKREQAATSQRPSKPDVPFRPNQVWRGDFRAGDGSGTRVCGEGSTSLTLIIAGINGRRVDAALDFDHEPSGHSGTYHVSGTYDPRARRLVLRPGKWIDLDIHDNDRAEDFVAVGLDGEVAADGQLFSGRMTSSPCTTFHLHPR